MTAGFLYLETKSAAHRLHPVTKMLALLLWFVPPMAFNQPLWELAIFVLAVALLAWARSLINLVRMHKFLLLLLVISTLLWALFLRDIPAELSTQTLLDWGPLQITDISLRYGAAMGLRITALIIFGLVFISTTQPEEFTYGLRRLGMPAAVSVALTLAFRFVPTLTETVRTVTDAQRARGLKLHTGGLGTRLRRYVHLIVPILGYGLRRADDLSRALEARGLSAPGKHTEYMLLKASWVDGVVLALSVGLAAASIYLRLSGHGELLPRL